MHCRCCLGYGHVEADCPLKKLIDRDAKLGAYSIEWGQLKYELWWRAIKDDAESKGLDPYTGAKRKAKGAYKGTIKYGGPMKRPKAGAPTSWRR